MIRDRDTGSPYSLSRPYNDLMSTESSLRPLRIPLGLTIDEREEVHSGLTLFVDFSP